MKLDTRTTRNELGFTLMELAIVAAIVVILALVGTPVLLRFKERNRTAEGIRQLYQIKKSVDFVARECGGYPIRNLGGGWAELRRIINRDAPLLPLGLPRTFPTTAMRDAASLQDYVKGSMLKGTCDLTNPTCSSDVASSTGGNFGSLFVKHDAASTYAADCNEDDGTTILGWNYVLLADYGAPTSKPVPVVCGNIKYRNSSVTAIVNGSGIVGAVRVADGSGMVGPDGVALPDMCTCGAWCRNNINNETGCCKTCTDAMGVEHEGIGFKY